MARADDILFIGNSFTQGIGDVPTWVYGGVPKIVEAIARSKGKDISTSMVANGGRDLSFHFRNSIADRALKKKKWTWVVLQNYSLKGTHAGDISGFMKDGEQFQEKVAKASPGARIALYETWAYGRKHAIYTGKKAAFNHPGEMLEEIADSCDRLRARMQKIDPQGTVVVVPVGKAFARCQEEHPEILLHSSGLVGDHKHASREGTYLASLVFYAALMHDSPMDAAHKFPFFSIDGKRAKALQQVAAGMLGDPQVSSGPRT